MPIRLAPTGTTRSKSFIRVLYFLRLRLDSLGDKRYQNFYARGPDRLQPQSDLPRGTSAAPSNVGEMSTCEFIRRITAYSSLGCQPDRHGSFNAEPPPKQTDAGNCMGPDGFSSRISTTVQTNWLKTSSRPELRCFTAVTCFNPLSTNLLSKSKENYFHRHLSS